MTTRFRAIRPLPGTLLTAALITIAHPPLELHLAIWIGLVPWLLALQSCRSWREAVVQGVWFNFLFGLGEAFWVAEAVPNYLDVSFGIGVVATFLHALIHQMQIVAFAPLFHWMSTKTAKQMRLMHLLLAGFLYTGLDWIIPNLFQDTFGFVLHNYPLISQLAEWGGVPLLTYVVLIVNLCVFSVVASPKRAVALPPIALIAIVTLGSTGLGTFRRQQLSESIAAPLKRIQVGVVQGNVSGELKRRWARGDPDAAREVLKTYIDSSRELFEDGRRPELVIWPETAYPGIFRRPENEEQARINVVFDRFIAQSKTPFVFGAYDREDRTDRRVLRNAIFFVEPKLGQSTRELSPMQVYHKHILFPVGEYLPLVGESSIREWLPNAGMFSRGEGPRAYDLVTARGERIRIGASICYEDLFPAHAIGLARRGAELIVNVSNDSWFGDYGLPQYHLIAAKLRSIETRLPQVRATNTGYSALILPTGDVVERSAYGMRASMNWSVPVIERRETLMVRWGDWFGVASLLLSGTGLLLVASASPGFRSSRPT